MGLVRKTLSISTLGLVNFRSKKELLRRAESDLDAATTELEREHAARSAYESRVGLAEKRTRQAELQALQAAKRAAKLRGKKGKRARTLADRLSDAIDAAEPKVSAATAEAKVRGRKARKQAKRAAAEAQVRGRKARKRAEKAAAEAQVRGRKAAKQTRSAAADARTRAKAEAKKGRALAVEAYADAKDRAEPLLDRAGVVAVDLRDEVVERGRKARKAAEKATAGRR
jgi:colicin import membrane protein